MKQLPHINQLPLRQKLVVLTGAGMSAESGLSTFRDSNGLWKQNDAKKLALNSREYFFDKSFAILTPFRLIVLEV